MHHTVAQHSNVRTLLFMLNLMKTVLYCIEQQHCLQVSIVFLQPGTACIMTQQDADSF